MGEIRNKGRTAWRDFVTDGLPASGENEPSKSEIRAFVDEADEMVLIALDAADGTYIIKQTKALLDADVAHAAGVYARVIGDSTPANNGYYVKSGSSGTGSWTFVSGDISEGYADAAADSATDALNYKNAAGVSAAAALASQNLAQTAAADAQDYAQTVFAQAEIVENAAAQAAISQAGATTATTQAGLATAALAGAVSARNDAITAAAGTGIYAYYDTKAAATAALAGIPANALVGVLADESKGGRRSLYRKESGVLVFKLFLDGNDLASVTLELFGGGPAASAATNATAFNAAMTALYAAGGGWLIGGRGVYTFGSGVTTFPNDGNSTNPRQPFYGFKGAGGFKTGRGLSPTQGTVFKMENTSGPARLDTRGIGLVSFENSITWLFGDTDDQPMLQTTGTTIEGDLIAFGESTKSGTGCDQDAVIFGGTDLAFSNGPNACFQGYGSALHVYGNRIRRIAHLRTYANGIRLTGTVWNASGSGLTNGCAVEISGDATNACTGNVIDMEIVELGGYKHAVYADHAAQNHIRVGGYDTGTVTASVVKLTANCVFNIITGGPNSISAGGAKPYLQDLNGANTYISLDQGDPSKIPELNVNSQFSASQASIYGTGIALTLQADDTQLAGSTVFEIRRPAVDGGALSHAFALNGSREINGNSAGDVTNSLSSGANYWSNGRGWGRNRTSGGGAITIDTGTDGHLFACMAAYQEFRTQADILMCRITTAAPGGAGVLFGSSADVGIGRASSTQIQTDASLMIGRFASDPTVTGNGVIYYNTATNKFRGRANGAWVDLH